MDTEASRSVTVVLEFPDSDDGVTPELIDRLDGLETTLAGQRCIVRTDPPGPLAMGPGH